MARTKRNIPYKHYWGCTKKTLKERIEDAKYRFEYEGWGKRYIDYLERDYKLHGTESRNYSCCTHEYFNRAHRVGRRIARDNLRPHIVLGENYDFDDAHYRRKLKGVWWEIY
jgi:hypothetical protein